MNKVRPFYIRITDDMTVKVVQDALDKCVIAGANAVEGLANSGEIHYQSTYPLAWDYFGVDKANKTSLFDHPDSFGIEAKEITLDQLDEWLGIAESSPKQIEWKNGDECRYKNDITHEYTYIGKHPNTDGHYIFSEEKGIVFVRNAYLTKPEMPEQKAERERLEAIREIQRDMEFSGSDYLAAERLYEKGYRKQ